MNKRKVPCPGNLVKVRNILTGREQLGIYLDQPDPVDMFDRIGHLCHIVLVGGGRHLIWHKDIEVISCE